MLLESLAQASFSMLRQANRRHDVVAIQITDPYELELPALGRLVLKDAETGEVIEVNTGDARKRTAFAERQAKAQTELARLFRSALDRCHPVAHRPALWRRTRTIFRNP